LEVRDLRGTSYSFASIIMLQREVSMGFFNVKKKSAAKLNMANVLLLLMFKSYFKLIGILFVHLSHWLI
jgi:hypothetical protein